MLQIIKDLYPLNRVLVSKGYDQSIEYLKKILPFKIIEFNPDKEINNWKIPPKWDVKEAKIIKDGKLIYDGTKHLLSVIALSKSFKGIVDLEELKKHLHYSIKYDDALPFSPRYQYRPWERKWGFGVTKNFYDSLTEGKYEIIIETEESKGNLKVLEYTHKGKFDTTFVFVAHLDHPGLANDDLSGCAVGIELFKKILNKKTKYTYKLVLLQEIIGSEYYLNLNEKGDVIGSLFLEMLGNKNEIALQESFTGDSIIEKAILKSLEELKIKHRKGGFKEIICNDEYIWEAYGIPMASISRFPYPEYHTDKDNPEIICEDLLNESLNILLKTIKNIESNEIIFKKFKGVPCLHNEKYSLYIDPGQPTFEKMSGVYKNEEIKKMRLLMDSIPIVLYKPRSLSFLANKTKISEKEIKEYLNKWVKLNLLEIQ